MRRADTPSAPRQPDSQQPVDNATPEQSRQQPHHGPSQQSRQASLAVEEAGNIPTARKRTLPDAFDPPVGLQQPVRPAVDHLITGPSFRPYSASMQTPYNTIPQAAGSYNTAHQPANMHHHHHHHSFGNLNDPQHHQRLLPQLNFSAQRHQNFRGSSGVSSYTPHAPQQHHQQRLPYTPPSTSFGNPVFPARAQQYPSVQPPLAQPAQQSQHQHQKAESVSSHKLAKLTSSDNITAAAAEADALNVGGEHDSPEPDPSKRVKGLRHFSRCVAEKVQAKGTTTYNEVADELVDEFTTQARNADSYDHKNIRRRVYDALNVLMAMGIIAKAKKEIRWIGLPTEGSYQRDLEALQKELLVLTAAEREAGEISARRQCLLKMLAKRNKLEQTQRGSLRTENSLEPEAGEGIMLPFLLLRSTCDAHVEIENTDDKSQFMISFSKPYHLVKDMEVVSSLCEGDYERGKSLLSTRGSPSESQWQGSHTPYPLDPGTQIDSEVYQPRAQQKSLSNESRNPTVFAVPFPARVGSVALSTPLISSAAPPVFVEPSPLEVGRTSSQFDFSQPMHQSTSVGHSRSIRSRSPDFFG
ncbi:E2F/DP family winged-helix DNA-binding domain-containing protein [Geranomyces variabilis]|nr:E2F/DP family winged-helix DNA-binding domain-containing protein [Geranomyces variabilis]KAJ3134670.1 Transcription factor Dp-2 [Geranomyces variabilis]